MARRTPAASTPAASTPAPRWLPVRRLRVRGPSMAPTISNGDVLLVRLGRAPRPGQIALVRWASRPAQLSVKRVVAAAGTGWFVVGDNRFGSTDSRELGPAEVLGVVGWRLWPRPGRLPPAPDPD